MILGKPEPTIPPTPAPKCPKCGGDMEQGFFLDRDADDVVNWIAGAPDYGIFGVKSFTKRILVPKTFRCIQCGYLESYAR